jgi:hypothetical protein
LRFQACATMPCLPYDIWLIHFFFQFSKYTGEVQNTESTSLSKTFIIQC